MVKVAPIAQSQPDAWLIGRERGRPGASPGFGGRSGLTGFCVAAGALRALELADQLTAWPASSPAGARRRDFGILFLEAPRLQAAWLGRQRGDGLGWIPLDEWRFGLLVTPISPWPNICVAATGAAAARPLASIPPGLSGGGGLAISLPASTWPTR